MNDSLSIDEYEALGQIGKGQKSAQLSACVSRNAKRLCALKYVAYAKDGSLSLTDKAKEALVIKNCIDGLRAVSTDPLAPLDAVAATFLCKKGHIEPRTPDGGFALTQRGRETLADIAAR